MGNNINNTYDFSTRFFNPISDVIPYQNPETAKPKGSVHPAATDTELRDGGYTSSEIKDLKRTGKVRCETCDSRTYVDQSNDGGVSFQTPTKLSPALAATAVSAHENEHVVRNAAKARSENRVAYSTVRIHTSVCSECNKSYVSGGETRTVSRKKAETQDFADKFENENVIKGIGKNVDKEVG
jgi:hypothetical protein